MSTRRMTALCWMIVGQLLAVFTQAVDAHPISMTDAVVNVTEKVISVEIRVLAEDLILYNKVKLGPANRYSYRELLKAAAAHQEFVLAGFIIRDSQGNRLKQQVALRDTSKIGKQGVLPSETKETWVVYHIRIPTKRPDFLTVSQTFGGQEAILPSLMDCLVLQDDVLLDKPVQLFSGQKHTVRFDWDTPPKKPKNWKELRQRREAELHRRLGISSYSGLYSFIYITDFEIRHEVLVPFLTLNQWTTIRHQGPSQINLAEQKASYAPIARLMRQKARIKIDGLTVAPVISRVSYFGLDINDFAKNAKPRPVSIHNARVGIIMSYPTKGRPNDLTMNWRLFSPHAPFLKATILPFDDSATQHVFRESDSLLRWKIGAKRKNPDAGFQRDASAKFDDNTGESAKTVVTTLLRNIYRAFDYREESDIYDALALSVGNQLLRKTYLDVRRSLLMAEQGGARSRVKKVEIRNVRVIDETSSQLVVETTWRVSGTVEHWGHIHTRKNEYQARIHLRRTDRWKIENMKLNRQQRVSFETGLRINSK